jgi:transcriptional regulator with XRE-family HTH domain
MRFADKLKTLRKQFDFSQEQLADKIGVSRQAITKWETDGGLPDIENLMAIASLFSVSMDELLSAEKTVYAALGFLYESVTEYDVEGERHFDIRCCGAAQVAVAATAGEKLRVRLASNVVQTLESDYKVRIDEHRSRMDVDICRVGDVSEAETKEMMSVYISLPAKYMETAELSVIADTLKLQGLAAPFELDGKVKNVRLEAVTGPVVLNSSADMDIFCDELPGGLHINQISATSVLHVPQGAAYFTKIKGRSNRIRFAADGKPSDCAANPDAEHGIELAGMSAELLIDAYSAKREAL